MGLGASIFMIAVGAILTYGITASVEGVAIDTIGMILMIVGALGALLSMIFWSSMSPFGRTDREDRVVERDTFTDPNGDVHEVERVSRANRNV